MPRGQGQNQGVPNIARSAAEEEKKVNTQKEISEEERNRRELAGEKWMLPYEVTFDHITTGITENTREQRFRVLGFGLGLWQVRLVKEDDSDGGSIRVKKVKSIYD